MKIGKYTVAGLLGKGGMGRVYRVELAEIGKIAALKLLSPHEHLAALLGHDAIERMFINEARILAGLRHKNVASVLDFDRDQSGRPFFVMEYHCMNLGAMTCDDHAGENPSRIIEPDRAHKYGRQVIEGLDRLHHAGILHRDIKPSNLLVTEEDQVRIIDLGLSLLRGEKSAVAGTLKIGTPFYTAPEQEKAPDRVDERADLYSTGVLMWRMLTGRFPSGHEKSPRPGGLNTLLGDCWDDFLLKAVSQEPDRRFSCCREMAEAFDRAYNRWKQELEQQCRLMPTDNAERPFKAARSRAPRKTPAKVPVYRARKFFGLDNLFRPAGGGRSAFEDAGGEIVKDISYGLFWQKGATRYPVDWQGAHEFIRSLNNSCTGGINTWRLPTVNELLLLIQKASALGDYCLPAVFEPGRARLWSSDRKSYTSAWFVDTELGYADNADFACICHVRAVTGPHQSGV